MLAAVELDDHASLEAYKVENEIAERMLSAELAAFELSAFQASPKRALRIRGVVAERALAVLSENRLVRLALHR
jgi:hypothetical protein